MNISMAEKGADDQAAGDGREGRLEDDEHDLGDHHALAEGGCVGIDAGHRVEHALQEQPVEAADEGVALGEGQAGAVDDPQHGDEREGDEHLHQHRQHVLAAHQAAVEQGQGRNAHQDHQRGADQHPGGVALVGHGGRRGRGGVGRGGGSSRARGRGIRCGWRTGGRRGGGRRGGSAVLRGADPGEAQGGQAQGEGDEKFSHDRVVSVGI
jgi:hypothetical protein